jgi:hypothetical protein
MRIFLIVAFLFQMISGVFADDVWDTEPVEVKQLGGNSFVAKKAAMALAARRAFQTLLSEKLQLKNVPLVSDQQISECLYEHSIQQEKYSDRFYMAEISHKFDKKCVAGLLNRLGVKYKLPSVETHDTTIAMHPDDFLRCWNGRLRYVVKLFAPKVVVLVLESPLSSFRKLGFRYAIL